MCVHRGELAMQCLMVSFSLKANRESFLYVTFGGGLDLFLAILLAVIKFRESDETLLP